MKLIGLYNSPFVRRVAISMHVLGFAYQHIALSVFRNAEAFKTYNPLLKAPTVVLSDGQVLSESSFILDYLDERSGERRLLPASGAERLAAMQTLAIALVTCEKAVAVQVESKLRPEDKHFAPFIERAREQVASGLGLLEAKLPLPVSRGGHLDQVAITTAVVVRFINHTNPDLFPQGRYPHLAALSSQCEQLPAFLATPLE